MIKLSAKLLQYIGYEKHRKTEHIQIKIENTSINFF